MVMAKCAGEGAFVPGSPSQDVNVVGGVVVYRVIKIVQIVMEMGSFLSALVDSNLR